MRFALRSAAVLALGVALSAPLRGEEGILVVHVEDVKGNPVSGVTFAPKGDGAAGSPTDRLGKTRLRLPPSTKPGHWVTLQILSRKDGPDWVFVSPWNQRTLVPSFANESENFVAVVLGERGNRDLLASDQAIRALATRTLEQLGPRLDKSEITEEERKRVLAEQAEAFGLKPEEIDKAVRAWGAKTQDPYDAGLAALYEKNYPHAEERLKKSLEVRRQERDEAQAKVAEAAFFLGSALCDQGKYQEAVSPYQESLEAGGEHYTRLNNLGIALLKAGDLQGAALRLERALDLSEGLGGDRPALATILSNLAMLYDHQGRYSEAEPLYQRSLKIREKTLGIEHPDVATSLNNLAALYEGQGRYSEAGPLYQRSLKIKEKELGVEHPSLAAPLNNLAEHYFNQGRYSEAEPLFQRSLRIRERTLGTEHPDVAIVLSNLAELYRTQDRYNEAETLNQRSLNIREKALGAEHPDVATSLHNQAGLYHSQGRYNEAESLYLRSLRIWEKVMGVEHPNVAASLNNLAGLYENQGRYSDAESLYQRSLRIREKVLGAEHPDVAISLSNLAWLYYAQERFEMAENSSRRAVAIAEKSLGPCHLHTATMLENRANILKALGRRDEAQPLLDRVKRIRDGNCTNPN